MSRGPRKCQIADLAFVGAPDLPSGVDVPHDKVSFSVALWKECAPTTSRLTCPSLPLSVPGVRSRPKKICGQVRVGGYREERNNLEEEGL